MLRDHLLTLLVVLGVFPASAFPAMGEEMQRVYLPVRISSESINGSVVPCAGYCELSMHLYIPAVAGGNDSKASANAADKLLRCCIDVLDSVSGRQIERYRTLLCADMPALDPDDTNPYFWEFFDVHIAEHRSYHVFSYFDMNGFRLFLADMVGKESDEPWIPFFFPISVSRHCHCPSVIMEEPLRIIQGVLFNFFNNDYAQISKYTTFPNDLKDPLRVRIPGINEPKSDAEAPAILMSLLSKDDPKVKEVEAAKNAFLTVARHQSKLADMDDAYKAFKEEMKPFMTALGWEEYFDGFNDAGNDRFNTKEEFLNTFRAKAASLVPTLDRETGCVLSFAPDYVWISKETVAAPPSQPEEGLYNLEEGCSYLRFRYIDGKMLVCGLGMYKDTFSDIIDTPEFWEALRKEWARRQSQPK